MSDVRMGTDAAMQQGSGLNRPEGKPEGKIIRGYVVPGMPHPLLVPDRSPSWRALADAFARARAEIARLADEGAIDLLLIYSTQWLSVIGHQIQANPAPEWVLVDQEWHDLGSMPYRFRMDAAFGAAYEAAARRRGLHARTVAYHGFPIDTGTVVALKLLDPEGRIPASVVSCNMYADRAETIVLGKAAADAVRATGKRAVALAVTALSNRMFTRPIDPREDRISSLKDDEWNRKILEILGAGRLEDVTQLAREVTAQANADQKMKAFWWLAATMGQHNAYEATVFAYQPVWGTGAALVGLVPSARAAAQVEFDEEDVEYYGGDRNVLAPEHGGEGAATSRVVPAPNARPPMQSLAAMMATLQSPDTNMALHAMKRTEVIATMQSAEVGEVPVQSPEASPIPAAAFAEGEQGGRMETPRARASTLPDSPRAISGTGIGKSEQVIRTAAAPRPVGAYPHARRVGELLYLSGIGPRRPDTDEIPGGPVRGPDGAPREYDVEAQTRQVIENVRAILEAAGSSLDRIFDVTVFLIDMDRDFATFNRVYREYFEGIQATRTTVAVTALPTPIAVELKVIAVA